MKHVIALALLSAAAGPALAGAGGFALVNGAGAPLQDVSIRRFGTNEWKPLGAAPSPGARQSVSFSDPDCAFDIRATVEGGQVVWSGVNLCEVSTVTLNRNPAGGAWVEYD